MSSDVCSSDLYQGTGVDPNAPYVAPLVELYPGQTVRMTLHNMLPDDPTCPAAAARAKGPHGGNGDNMMISINPGVDFQYEYNVAPDHPAGTFWYHSHRHGSTALQVSSGM